MYATAKYILGLTCGLACAGAALLCACEREEYLSDGSIALAFSTGELNFDTVLAPLGSTTYLFTVHNRSGTNLCIDRVALGRGAASPFVMNVDGRPGVSVGGVRLARRDSLYVFVELRRNQALRCTDSIVFELGGSRQYLPLMAYGQECIVMGDTLLPRDYTFTAEKPYLVVGTATVAEGRSASVAEGATLYFGASCGINVHGTLLVAGTSASRARLTYIRADEEWYANLSGQWRGLYFGSASTGSIISFADITGAATAIAVEDTLQRSPDRVQLRVSNTTISNANVGIQADNAHLQVDNSLLANTTRSALRLRGGRCRAYSCTVGAAYSRAAELVSLGGGSHAPLDALFAGCIIYGGNRAELGLEADPEANGGSYRFDHCIIRLPSGFGTADTAHYRSIGTDDPRFANAAGGNFRLRPGSPAIGAGTADISALAPIDLDGRYRSNNDLGAYLYAPE